jgi:hypothetical protein
MEATPQRIFPKADIGAAMPQNTMFGVRSTDNADAELGDASFAANHLDRGFREERLMIWTAVVLPEEPISTPMG